MNSTPPEAGIEKEYSQGICDDGAAILCDGQPLTIEEILEGLRERDKALGKLAAMESQELDTNYCALKSITDDQVRKVAKAFWRRIYAYRNDYGIELPDPMPVEFMAHMATALTWVDKPVPADKPAVAVPDVLQKLRLEVAEAINILAMCGDQTPVDQLGKKLAAALNASAPSHSQQSADAVKAFCKDIGLYDPEYDDQEYIEVSRHKLKEHVESLYDRRPSHESEQPDSEGE